MKYVNRLLFLLLSFWAINIFANDLPKDFVYLKDVDPTILQDIRYAGDHNFIGRPIRGYHAAECILTQQAAYALKKVQAELLPSGYSLKVFDCYRPKMAVSDFIQWSKQLNQQQMKAEFYPRVDKADFFKLGYVAARSGHSRGSTVDLTIVPVPTSDQETFQTNQPLVACYAPYNKRFRDGSIDMGTGFDCMDELSHPLDQAINPQAYRNRMKLRNIMEQYGFVPYFAEWWHFTLKDEPFPHTYFNFAVNRRVD
jgi:D-alanyl-D-alanine dipeptidase